MTDNLSVRVTRFLHSRWMLLTMAVAVVACGAAWYLGGREAGFDGDRGLLFHSANMWFGDADLSAAVNVVLTLTLALMMITLNRTYTLQRTSTALDGTLFLAMSLGTPRVLCAVNSGTVLALVIITCLYMLYAGFGDTARRGNIFAVFFLLSAMSMTQYCFLLYILVFIIGVMQMRVFGMRALVAILLGILAPWWLVLGLGIVSPQDVHIPSFGDIFGKYNLGDNLGYLVTVGITVLILVVGWVLNFPRMIAYNAHKRAFNGTLSVVALATVIAVFADYSNAMVYITTLYMSAAFQISNLFDARRKSGGYLSILLIILLYMMIYIGNWLK